MKIRNVWALLGLAAALALPSPAGTDRLEMKLRVFEGARQGTLSPPESVTSSYVRPTLTASLDMKTGTGVDKEKDQIMRVFNLQDANLLTEADLVLGVGELEMSGPTPGGRVGTPADTDRHFFRLNGNAFMVTVILKEQGNPNRFLIVFNDRTGDKPVNVLTTEMLLAGGHRAVFGFEDKQGKPYFCSFHITGPPDKILPPPPPPPPPPPLSAEQKKALSKFEAGAEKVLNEVKPPKLLKSVQPAYPEEARQARVQGAVVLNVRTDKQGSIKEVMVLKSVDEGLAKAAIEAVKQWKYEPFIKDGEAKEVVFTVTVQFKLK